MTVPKEPPHTSLSSKEESEQIQNQEQQQLADAQSLATPEGQAELHSSQTPEADASGAALKDEDLSTPKDSPKGETH